MSGSAERGLARRWLVVGVAALVVIVAVVVYLATRGTSDEAGPLPSASSTTSPASPSPSATEPASEPAVTPSEDPAAPSPSDASTPAPTGDPSAAPTARPTEPAVPLDTTAEPRRGVTAELATIESVTGVAELPGDVGGPSLRVTVKISNDTDEDVDLSGAVVVLYTGKDRAPAIELSKPGAKALPSSVAPGSSVTGVYVFNVPVAKRDLVAVEVDLASKVPVVVFQGDARPVG